MELAVEIQAVGSWSYTQEVKTATAGGRLLKSRKSIIQHPEVARYLA
jgi:hypothetical protein